MKLFFLIATDQPDMRNKLPKRRAPSVKNSLKAVISLFY